MDLYFIHLDPIPPYVLASGAFSILKDISNERAKKLGAQRETFIANGNFEQMLRWEASKPVEISSSITISNINMIPHELRLPSGRKIWKTLQHNWNFLKHAGPADGGEDETLAEEIPWPHTETLILTCALAYNEMGFFESKAINFYIDHCYAQRGLFPQCRYYKFRPSYAEISERERLEICRSSVGILAAGVDIAIVN